MHKIYENVYIGAFIYLLGAISERKRIKSNTASIVSVGLYQQTPFDSKIGDFFGALDGRMIIIEFKKDVSSMGYEEIGRQFDLAKLLTEDKNLFAISIKSHFIGIGIQESNSASVELKPYIPIESIADECNRISISMHEFIENYCNGTKIKTLTFKGQQHLNSIGHEGLDFLEYLKALASLDKSTRSSGSGTLFISIKTNGEIQCIPVDSIQTLVFMIEQSIEMKNAENETIKQEAKDTSNDSLRMK